MLYGFSTGALARGDFDSALRMLAPYELEAVEISALRLTELGSVVEAIPRLCSRERFRHVTVHAPSKFDASEEGPIASALASVLPLVDGVILHAESFHDPSIWRAFGGKVLVENADIRKRRGRTAAEMEHILAMLPEARVCLDLAHAHQVDFSLTETRRMLRAFGDRIGQIHLSQLDHACRHEPLTYGIVDVFHTLTPQLPDTAVILETCVTADRIGHQLALARRAMERRADRASHAAE